MKISENIKKVIIVVVTIAVAVAACILALPAIVRVLVYLAGILSPFIVGFICARLLSPITRSMQRRFHLPRTASAVIVIILAIAALVGIIGGLGYKLFDQIRIFCYDWPTILSSLRSNWESWLSHWNDLYGTLPEAVRLMLDRFTDNISAQAVTLASEVQILNNAQSFAKSLPGGIIWTIVFILALFFNVTRQEQIDTQIAAALGEKRVTRMREILIGCRKYLGGYVRAQIVLMFIIFALISMILSIFGAPYALVVAAITALLDALPFFGSGLTLLPLSVVYFLDGQVRLGVVYVVTYLAIVLMRRALEPKLVSDNMGFNPIVTLIAMYVAYRWWGVSGLIIGPILLIIFMSLYEVGLFDRPCRALKQLFAFIIKEIKMFVRYMDTITK